MRKIAMVVLCGLMAFGAFAGEVTVVKTLDEFTAALTNKSVTEVQIPFGVDIAIPSGKKLTIPVAKSVTVDGRLLVIGSLVNNGAVAGSGSYATAFTKIVQGAVVTPTNAFASYPAFRYRTTKTTSAIGSLTGNKPTCAKATKVYFIEGSEKYVESKVSSPAAAVCTVDSSTALNSYVSIDSVHEKLAEAFHAAYPNPTATPPANKFVVLLKGSQSIDQAALSALNPAWTTEKGHIGKGFRVDCLAYTFTIKSPVANSTVYLVNGTTISHGTNTAYTNWSTEYVIGCTTKASVAINCNSASATSRVELYDCKDFATANQGSADLTLNNKGYYVFTGGPYTIPEKTLNLRVVGGSYTTDPTALCPAGYVGEFDGANYEVVKKSVDYSFFIGDEGVEANRFATLADAVQAANGATIKLAKDAAVSSDLIVGAKAVVDLNGFRLSGPGEIVVAAAGDLTLVDSSIYKGATGTCANAIDVAGSLTIAYGAYSGAIRLRAGSAATTYAGSFALAFAIDPGATAAFRGGRFPLSVGPYLGEGYQEMKIGSQYCVGRRLFGTLTKKGGSNTKDEDFDVRYVGDSALYESYLAQPAFDSDSAAFFAHAEADSAISPLGSFTIDVIVNFDRDMGSNTLKFYYTIFGTLLPVEIPAKTEYRLFYHIMKDYLAELGGSQIQLSRFLGSEFNNALPIGVGNETSAPENIGAICDVEICLYNGNSKVVSLGKTKVTLGARANVAYIARSGSPEFHSALSLAVQAAAEGETIVLARESAEGVTVAKAITIDTKGFAVDGVVAGKGYSARVEGERIVFAKSDWPEEWADIPADDAVKARFAGWRAEKGAGADLTTESAKQAFLLDIAADAPIPALRVEKIAAAEGIAVLAVSAAGADLGRINGVFFAEAGETPGELKPLALSEKEVDYVAGKAIVTFVSGRFFRAAIGFTGAHP